MKKETNTIEIDSHVFKKLLIIILKDSEQEIWF